MTYIIKVVDRENNSEAKIECQDNMILEDLSLKIKSEFHLPCTDEVAHCFQMSGKVYVTHRAYISELWEYDDMCMYPPEEFQQRINYPKERDIRSSLRYRLNQVFTVKGSTVVFILKYRYSEAHKQRFRSEWIQVYCTLIDRIE